LDRPEKPSLPRPIARPTTHPETKAAGSAQVETKTPAALKAAEKRGPLPVGSALMGSGHGAPSPILATPKLSDATVVAEQITSDSPVQAFFAHHEPALRNLFSAYATKRLQGVQLLTESAWLRLCKSLGICPAMVSSKSLRHFALCSGPESGLTLANFTTGLGLCAIYVVILADLNTFRP
jgi:hypothetical protein